MEKMKKWEEMKWQEKREERFKRWLSPRNAKFASKEAEKLYKARVTRFIKAIKMEEPDRVPCILPMGYFPAYYAGVSFRTLMYDYSELKRAWMKFVNDFSFADCLSGPGQVLPGRILDAIDLKREKWPGHGISEDASYYQFVEGEYMKADEYEWLISDPSDFTFRAHLPRTTGLLKSFTKLPSLRSFQLGRLGLVPALSDPDISKAFQTMIDMGEEYRKWQSAVGEVNQAILGMGMPSLRGAPEWLLLIPLPICCAAHGVFRSICSEIRRKSSNILRQPLRK